MLACPTLLYIQQRRTNTLQSLQLCKCNKLFSLRLHYKSNLSKIKDQEMTPLQKTHSAHPSPSNRSRPLGEWFSSIANKYLQTHQNSQLTHLQRYPCWLVPWCQWGRHWRWHSDQSWAWRAWLWFLKRKIHKSSGIHHIFQLHTSHCWNTTAKMKHKEREEEGSREGTEVFKKFRKWKLWTYLIRRIHKLRLGSNLKKACEESLATRHLSAASRL